MHTSPSELTSVRWNELCPWLLLVRSARAALLVRMIVLAAVGVVLTQAGWSAIEGAILDDADLVRLARLTEHPAPPLFGAAVPTYASQPFDAVDSHPWAGPLVRGWAWAIQPLTRLAEARTWRSGLALVLAGAWGMAVWGLFGGAMGRISALYLTRGETIGPIAALRSAVARWTSTVAAPSFCFGVIASFALLLLLAGFVMRLSFFTFVGGVFWPVALVIGLTIAIFAFGLILGWPLMWSTVAAERTDAFDAVSRGYAFTYQRPLHLAFFVLVATAFGLLAQKAVDLIIFGALDATHWAVERGLGDDSILAEPPPADETAPQNAGLILPPAASEEPPADGEATPQPKQASAIRAAGGKMIRFWSRALATLATAFPMAYLWPAAMGIYLLQRRLVDSTEIGDVALDVGEPDEGLPPLTSDAATGAPMVAPSSTEKSATVSELRGGST